MGIAIKRFGRLACQPLGLVALGMTLLISIAFVCFGSMQNLASFLNGNVVFSRSDVLNLGEVQEGKEHLLKFRLHNWSYSDVSVVGGRASCSCTSIEDVPARIPRFGSSEISVRFSVTQAGSKDKKGIIDNRVFLVLDNGQETLNLRFVGSIEDLAAK